MPTPSNPNATWEPQSERFASPPDRTAADRLDGVDDREQEEPDEFMLPTSPLPASSNPNAIWMPKSERGRERKVLPSESAGPQSGKSGRLPRSASTVSEEVPQTSRSHFKGDLPRIATAPVTNPPEREPAPLAIPEYKRATALPSLPSDLDLPFVPRKPKMQERAVPVLLTIVCLLFLVATSFLAFLFLSKSRAPLSKLTLTASPSTLRANDTFTLVGTGFGNDDLISFSRDSNIALLDEAHTNSIGTFTVMLTVSSNWDLGWHTIHATDEAQQLAASTQIFIEAPSTASPVLQLRLPNPTIEFGAGDPGAISHKTITLINAGGGQLTWQARSDSSWLSVTPSNGTFSGSTATELIVNRGALPPQAYSGHVTFTQQGGPARSLTLAVSMSVTPAQASAATLVLFTTALSFSGSTAQNPAPQTMTLRNSGGQPLNWSATAATGNGAPWLSITPQGGPLAANTTTQVTVSVQSVPLQVGSYSGTISFTGGANPNGAAQVVVTLNVVAPANLAVSTNSLSLQAAQGHTSAGQITIQDSGGQPLDWTVNTTLASGANWLSVSPTSGSLSPGATQNITVTANAGTLAVNSYQGTLTFSYGGTSTTRQVTVSLAVSLPPMPGISVQPPTLVFNTTQGINPPAQSFTITNSGNAPLNWATSEDANGTTYAATSSSGSTSSIAPAKSVTITVTPKVASAGPGAITALITVSDSDTGSTVPKQQVAVTINITSAAIITAAPGNMVFNQNSTITSSQQFLTISNAGSAPLNWSLAQGSQTPAPWLSVNTTSGTVAPNDMVVLFVTCDSSQLSPGTYTATLVISDTDPHSPVLSQTVTVTLTVGS